MYVSEGIQIIKGRDREANIIFEDGLGAALERYENPARDFERGRLRGLINKFLN